MTNTYPNPYKSAAKDSIFDPSGCYNRECVSYCAWKVKELTGKWLKDVGDMNANKWDTNATKWKYKKVSSPKNGGRYIGQTDRGNVGHVVWFEEVLSNGNIKVSEYNYASAGNYNTRSIAPSAFTWYEVQAPKKTEVIQFDTPRFLYVKTNRKVLFFHKKTSDGKTYITAGNVKYKSSDCLELIAMKEVRVIGGVECQAKAEGTDICVAAAVQDASYVEEGK